jgi:hypothetical protein
MLHTTLAHMGCGEAVGQDVRVTLKSDVFAFGVTLWEMATRMHPWHGLGVMAVFRPPNIAPSDAL